MNSSYPRSDRPSLQRRPLTAPAPIRPPCATATATTMTPAAAVLKPHPLRRAISHCTAPIQDDAEEGSEDDAVAAAAEELREIVANLSLRQRRPPFDWTSLPNQADSRSTAAAAAVRRPSPSTSSSSSYLSRALPRTPSRGGSRNGGVGVGVPLKRKASLGGGGTGTSLSSSVVVPESAPMQVDTATAPTAAGDELCAPGRRRDTPPWIGLDGKRYSPPSRAMTRNPFLRQTTSSALGSLPPHPQIVRAATEPVLPPHSASSKLSTTKT